MSIQTQITFTEENEYSKPVKTKAGQGKGLDEAIIWFLENRARKKEATVHRIISYLESRNLISKDYEKLHSPDRVGRIMASKPYFKSSRKYDSETGSYRTFWRYNPDPSPYKVKYGEKRVDVTLEWIEVNNEIRNCEVLIKKYPNDGKLKKHLQELQEKNKELKRMMGVVDDGKEGKEEINLNENR